MITNLQLAGKRKGKNRCGMTYAGLRKAYFFFQHRTASHISFLQVRLTFQTSPQNAAFLSDYTPTLISCLWGHSPFAMAPSLDPPMTPSPGATPSQRPRRMVPIIPAIPRSLEKRKFKEDVKSSEDGGGIGSPNRPTSPNGEKVSQVVTAVPQTQAVPNGALNGQDENDENDVMQESVVQEAAIETIENAGSEREIISAEGKSTFHSTQKMKADFSSRQHQINSNPCPRLRNREKRILLASTLLPKDISTIGHSGRCLFCE